MLPYLKLKCECVVGNRPGFTLVARFHLFDLSTYLHRVFRQLLPNITVI